MDILYNLNGYFLNGYFIQFKSYKFVILSTQPHAITEIRPSFLIGISCRIPCRQITLVSLEKA